MAENRQCGGETKPRLQEQEENRFAVKKAELLRRTGMTEEELNSLLQELPEVKNAREAQQRAEETKADAELEAQLQIIRKLDPQVNSLEALAETETFPEICELVMKGYALADAYKVVNFDTLMKNGMNAARQNAVNDIRSKQHLSRTQSAGEGGVSVPEEVRRLYQALNPDAGLAEIQRHYAKSHIRK